MQNSNLFFDGIALNEFHIFMILLHGLSCIRLFTDSKK